ncbi:hypothetical protein NL676_020915 [Syzygium grande]|nr:hypothetical protein NL676_020915 [Syzygium grande]
MEFGEDDLDESFGEDDSSKSFGEDEVQVICSPGRLEKTKRKMPWMSRLEKTKTSGLEKTKTDLDESFQEDE